MYSGFVDPSNQPTVKHTYTGINQNDPGIAAIQFFEEDYNDNQKRMIAGCGWCMSNTAKKRCEQCKQRYCNQMCQYQDWKRHKKWCQKK